jgi:hypothetical protein
VDTPGDLHDSLPVPNVVLSSFLAIASQTEDVVALRVLFTRIAILIFTAPRVCQGFRFGERHVFFWNRISGRFVDEGFQTLLLSWQHEGLGLVADQVGLEGLDVGLGFLFLSLSSDVLHHVNPAAEEQGDDEEHKHHLHEREAGGFAKSEGAKGFHDGVIKGKSLGSSKRQISQIDAGVLTA